ncbi:MAG TPA: hypothetical protein VFY14_16930, partial [Streptomyces sp.]|nr:hypothetical protein [Streptomyces sp.]
GGSARGRLRPDGAATPEGHRAHRAVGEAADLAAARPRCALDTPAADRLHRLLTPLARACAAAPHFPDPTGLPAAAHR